MGNRNSAQLRATYHSFLALGIVSVFVALWFIALQVYLDSQLQYVAVTASFYGGNSQSFVELALLCCIVVAALVSFVAAFVFRKKMLKVLDEEREACDKIRGLAGGHLSASDFLTHRDTLRQSDFTGVYVLHNKTKDMYYVGQSIKVVDRVGQHFTGHGNGDVYADFKYGDEFEISTVALADSGYDSLNDLERETIAAYDAYDHGYNRTAGNAR